MAGNFDTEVTRVSLCQPSQCVLVQSVTFEIQENQLFLGQ